MCLEGQISSKTVSDSLTRGRKASGDLIPWNVSEQFNDREFPKLAGGRIVRIATHPNYQKVGHCADFLFFCRSVVLCKTIFFRWDTVNRL